MKRVVFLLALLLAAGLLTPTLSRGAAPPLATPAPVKESPPQDSPVMLGGVEIFSIPGFRAATAEERAKRCGFTDVEVVLRAARRAR